MKFHFSSINLGCTKNLVDTQFLLGKFFMYMGKKNYDIEYNIDPRDADTDFVFLNTCGFLSSGREEMMETIHKLLAAEKKVYVLGCAVHYFQDLVQPKTTKKSTPDTKASADEKQQWHTLLQSDSVFLLSRKDLEHVTVQDLIRGYSSTTFDGFAFVTHPRAYTNAQYKFEYLKIAEGCNNQCSFCIIPKIRGRQISRPIEEICQEVQTMINSDIKEIILIAQDSTRYGTDVYGAPSLFPLLEAIDAIPGDFRYRVLYLYPDIVTLAQIKQLTKLQKFIPYFDVPLQHISSSVLQRMGRFYDETYIRTFLQTIKKLFPICYIRTNFIIGFPGETKQDHKKLLEFIDEGYFASIALFEYHDEPLAPSSKLDGKVDDATIRQRFISAKIAVEKVTKLHANPTPALSAEQSSPLRALSGEGEKLEGFVMSFDEKKKTLTVRPWLHAPEIDAYETIRFDQVTALLDGEEGIDVGSYISWEK